MKNRLLQSQNTSKALEIRLEQDAGTYYVIIAGMTIHLQSACIGGACEGAPGGDYLQLENETYMSKAFTTYYDARSVYDAYRTQYIE